MRPIPLVLTAALLLPGAFRLGDGAAGVARLRGDVSGDGALTSADALAVLTHIVGRTLPPGHQPVVPVGDGNCDGEATAADALLVLRSVVGQDVSAFCVGRVMVEAVEVAPATAALQPGDTLRLAATLRDGAGGELSGRPIAWSSSDPAVAGVDGDGLVTALATGTVSIAATSERVSGAAALVVEACASDLLVDCSDYAAGFESGAGPEWSTTATTLAPNGSRRFLGRFGNGVVRLTLTGLPAHDSVTLAFDLLVIQSMDGNSTTWGPDVFAFRVADGPTLMTTTFSNAGHGQAYPGSYPGSHHPDRTGASAVNSLGYGGSYGDTVYRLAFTFAHTAGTLVLEFSASGLQGIGDESWGLDEVAVRVHR